MLRTAMPPSGPRDWAEAVKLVLDETDAGIETRLDRLREILLQARREMDRTIRVTSPTLWKPQHLGRIREEIDRTMDRLRIQFSETTKGGQAKAAAQGRQMVAAPLATEDARAGGAPHAAMVPSLDVNALALAQELAGDLINGVTQSLGQTVKASVARGILGELSPDEVATQILGQLDAEGLPLPSPFSTQMARAETIARTEMVGAFNRSNNDTMSRTAKALPGLFDKVWLATKDSRTRPSHREMNGKRVPADGQFRLAGVDVDGPGDPALPPAEVINCRCSVAIVPAQRSP